MVAGDTVVLQQTQPKRVSLEPTVKVAGVDASCIGISVTIEPFIELRIFCIVAVTAPFTSVVTEATYFVCCDAALVAPQMHAVVVGRMRAGPAAALGGILPRLEVSDPEKERPRRSGVRLLLIRPSADYAMRLRRLSSSPTSPTPTRAIVAGSGNVTSGNRVDEKALYSGIMKG